LESLGFAVWNLESGILEPCGFALPGGLWESDWMQRFLEVALECVDEAGRRLRTASGETKRIELKGAIDLVTETDREIERWIVARLTRAFPDHVIVAEEATADSSPAKAREGQYVWYLDPLDGTTNFAHGYPQFCVSLALARGAELLLGFVHDPMRGERFQARRGAGATLNGETIRVSATERLDSALVGTGFPYDRRTRADVYLRFMKEVMTRAQGIRRAGSAALDLCALASGRLDGFWEAKLRPWDTAAGVLIAREAGAKITDFAGREFDLYGEEILASNGRIHAEMVEALKQAES
jgi:myo-inositol-1(or 4)-monophosphatase